MRGSATKIDTGRTRMRTGVTPTATIRVQRATDVGGRNKSSNPTSTTTTSNVTNPRVSRRRITQYSSTDVPPIPPRTRQTNGGGINLSRSQGIHTNQNFINNGTTNQTRNQQAANQTLSRTTPQLSQTQGTQNRNRPNPTTNSTASTSHSNRNTEEGRLFPRAPPPAEAARRTLHRNPRNNETTTTTNRTANTNRVTNTNTNVQININNNRSNVEENRNNLVNNSRTTNQQQRTNDSPRTILRRSYNHPSPAVQPGEPIVPTVQQNRVLQQPQNRTQIHHQPSPSENVGTTREPQVLQRSTINVTNRTSNSNRASMPSATTATISNPHLTLNINIQSNTVNNQNNQTNNNNNTNRPQPQFRTPTSNNEQQRNNRPTFAYMGTHTTPANLNNNQNANRNVNQNTNRNVNQNTNRNVNQNDGITDDNHLGLFDELFSILDNFPINIVPLIPMMFESSFGPFLESVIPLYLAHYERNQIIRAIDESMREAENPRPEPPKKVKLINHIINEEDAKNGRQCLICLSDFVPGEQTVMLKCGHFFHKDCLMPWFVEHHTCPTCRENIDEADLES